MIFVKKILLPIIFAVLLYVCAYFCSPNIQASNFIGVFAFIFFLLSIRLCDEAFDYKEDIKNGKSLMPLSTNIVILVICVIGVIVFSILSKQYLTMLSVLLIPMVGIENKILQYAKATMLPMFLLLFNRFLISMPYLLLVLIIFAGDIILIAIKGKKRAIN